MRGFQKLKVQFTFVTTWTNRRWRHKQALRMARHSNFQDHLRRRIFRPATNELRWPKGKEFQSNYAKNFRSHFRFPDSATKRNGAASLRKNPVNNNDYSSIINKYFYETFSTSFQNLLALAPNSLDTPVLRYNKSISASLLIKTVYSKPKPSLLGASSSVVNNVN